MNEKSGTEIANTNNKSARKTPIVIGLAVALLLTAAVIITVRMSSGKDRTVTYSVYPYLPDIDYYSGILEAEWEKLHPDISLEYVPYDCYFDGDPEGIDVIMYDVLLEREFVEKGYLKPMDIDDFADADDFFDFTLEPAAGYADNYGIPVFLCCNLLIYDRDNKVFYCDMAGICTEVPDDKNGLCMDLIGIMTDVEVMERECVKEGALQYLLFPRKSFYNEMEKDYPIYAEFRKIVGSDNNKLFRAYGSFMEESLGY